MIAGEPLPPEPGDLLRNRILIVVTALLMLPAMSVPATAAVPRAGTYKATNVYQAYDFKFRVIKRSTGYKVTNIVSHMLWSCGGSTSEQVTVAPDSRWAVRNGAFSGRKKEVHGSVTDYYTFKGKFVTRRKVKGFIRLERVVAGSVCDTYNRTFTATLR